MLWLKCYPSNKKSVKIGRWFNLSLVIIGFFFRELCCFYWSDKSRLKGKFLVWVMRATVVKSELKASLNWYKWNGALSGSLSL